VTTIEISVVPGLTGVEAESLAGAAAAYGIGYGTVAVFSAMELTPAMVTPAAVASALALAFASATAAVRAWASAPVSSSTRKLTPSIEVAPAATAASTRSPTLAISRTVTATMFVTWNPTSFAWPLLE